MTLRDFGASIQDWFDRTSATVSNEHVLDWPVSVVLLVFLGGFLGFAVIMAAFGGFFGWLTGKVFQSPDEMQKQIHLERGIPSDPRLRQHWANRTGPYSPEPSDKPQPPQ